MWNRRHHGTCSPAAMKGKGGLGRLSYWLEMSNHGPAYTHKTPPSGTTHKEGRRILGLGRQELAGFEDRVPERSISSLLSTEETRQHNPHTHGMKAQSGCQCLALEGMWGPLGL